MVAMCAVWDQVRWQSCHLDAATDCETVWRMSCAEPAFRSLLPSRYCCLQPAKFELGSLVSYTGKPIDFSLTVNVVRIFASHP